MKRLSRFAALPRAERRLLVRGWTEVLAMRVLTWALPFGRVRTIVARRGVARTAAGEARPDRDQIARAVITASAYVPGGLNCLVRALAAETMLRRFGYDGELRIGVDRTAGGRFRAHAWIESAGRPIIGDFELENYALMSAPTTARHRTRSR
jgi:hypothetical protein